jgi:uncharacterized protein YprB with RNaseH-like and TPR domain
MSLSPTGLPTPRSGLGARGTGSPSDLGGLGLRERLAGLGYRSRPFPGQPTKHASWGPRGRRAEGAAVEDVARRLGGEVRENAHGPVVILEQLVQAPLGRLPEAETARLLGVSPSGDALRRPCFFDTETTGVSGGAGTQAFLCALAWPAPGGVLVRQYLLADPALERPLLEEVRADLLDGDALVTYNGRAFDLPLLEGRLLMSRMAPLPPGLPHLDLLKPVRRIFRARLGGCTLGGVEEAVLGRDRGWDIPGFLIPESYFAFLRRGDPEPLREVLAHNRQDVVSLSLLLDHLCALVEDGRDPAAPPADPDLRGAGPLDAAHPLDRFGVGRLLEMEGETAAATAVYAGLWREVETVANPAREAAWVWDGDVWPGAWSPVELGYVVGLRLAVAHRRAGRRDLAVPILESLWRRHPRPLEAGIMLAKHLEHQRRDHQGALELVAAALEAVDLQPPRDRREERLVEDLTRRRARLSRRVGA